MKYRILLQGKVEENLLKEIQAKHSGDIEGINDLYDQLIKHGSCDSEISTRIYYVAYTLSLENIEMIIVRVN